MPAIRFGEFLFDPDDRRLVRGGMPVELNARYLDALALLVAEAGRLVSKDRFMAEVWRGVPVTDEALTQCIRTLRRQLDDDAAHPQFIETVPKHGYRFVAAVVVEGPVSRSAAIPPTCWRERLLLAGAGTIGAGAAGLIGGIAYGSVGATQTTGGVSALLVLIWLTMMAALTGGAGVSLGIAAAEALPDPRWRIVGGAAGGLIVGGAVKLMGIDAFNLLLGHSPGNITGAFEGLLLGGGVGTGAWLASRVPSIWWRAQVGVAAMAGSGGAILAVLAGGRLMGGSLDLLAHSFLGSRLRLDPLGVLVGERGFGPVAALLSGAIEGALFGGCIVGAMLMARGACERTGERP